MSTVAHAIDRGTIGERVWLYSNYHCNLACTYCLTDSAPSSPRRELPPGTMLTAARQAADLGFKALGVTGGEPFLGADLPRTVAAMAAVLPTLVLSSATLFSGTPHESLRPLPSTTRPSRSPSTGRNPRPTTTCVLSATTPGSSTPYPGSSRWASESGWPPRSIPPRRSATTRRPGCATSRSLGVSDDDLFVRPVVRRGRAAAQDMGVHATIGDLPPELTITVDNAFWSPSDQTVRNGHLDTDLLVTRTTNPLAIPASTLTRLAEGQPPRRRHPTRHPVSLNTNGPVGPPHQPRKR